MTDEPARALLGLPVCADGVRLGTVGAVWMDTAGGVLGMEVTSAWNDTTLYLPFAAAKLGDRVLRASSLAILGTGPTAFFEQHGARRVVAAEAVGFGAAEAG
ncbi:MAG: PRC-barrel domain-containing protein [Gaiella sp.]|nr:PRC-barrel domain-containing protein [Gaiella sp.]